MRTDFQTLLGTCTFIPNEVVQCSIHSRHSLFFFFLNEQMDHSNIKKNSWDVFPPPKVVEVGRIG